LIQNGQFEVASGSWSSFDEACLSFEDMINNLMMGHNFLMREFQYTPKVAWNVEAAGHSATAGRIFSQLGYQAQFFSKADENMKQFIKDPKVQGHNFLLRTQSKDSGQDYSILTSVFKDKTCYPPGMNTDENPKKDAGEIFQPEKDAVDYNAPDQSVMFLNYV